MTHEKLASIQDHDLGGRSSKSTIFSLTKIEEEMFELMKNVESSQFIGTGQKGMLRHD
jgi:hypothetical protein